MKRIVRNRADARLLPSRHDFALFRLVSWMRLRKAAPAPATTMYFTDRHQSAAEMWTIGLWLLVASSLYAADALPLALPLALVGGFLIALTALQAGVVVLGLTVVPLWKAVTRRDTLGLRVNGVVIMVLFLTATAWASLRPTWVRYAGWITVLAVLLNLLAAGVLHLYRDAIAQLEASVVGGVASER